MRCFALGVKCEIGTCNWSGGRPKHGHLQEAAREMRCGIFLLDLHLLSELFCSVIL